MKFLQMASERAILFFLLFLVGCGGGSRGSGGQFYDGYVGDESGRALVEVSVTILSTGATAKTDSNGRFLIETENLEGSVKFLLEGSNFSGRTETPEIPSDASRIAVTFKVGKGPRPSITVELSVVEHQVTPTPKPAQTATPPTALPSATPTLDNQSGSGSDKTEDGSGSGGNQNSNDDSHNGTSSGGDGQGDDSGHSGSDQGSDDSDGNGVASPTPTPTKTSIENDDDTNKEGEEVEVEGAINAVSSSILQVGAVKFTPSAETEYRGLKGEKIALADLTIGELVKAKGRVVGGILNLERVERKK